MNTAILAFGSNLENPVAQIQKAATELAALPEIADLRLSSLYRTAPVGYADQPDFVNAVAVVQTELSAPSLLKILQNMENTFGRIRTFRNAPRVLDLDIIDFNHENWDTPDLILPHPRAHERGFVMIPLAEILPDFILGEHGQASEIANKLGFQDIEKLP